MNNARMTSSGLPLRAGLLLLFSFFAAGCEFDGFSAEGGAEDSTISLASLNGEATGAEAEATTEPDAEPDAGDSSSTPPTSTTTTPTVTPPAPAPVPTPAPSPTSTPGSCSPGQIVIPSEFLAHGTCIYFRWENCTLANGLVKKVSSTVYSIPMPSDPIWRKTDYDGRTAIGTRAKFSDGAWYDGYVANFNSSYSMPVFASGQQKGPAFWIRAQ